MDKIKEFKVNTLPAVLEPNARYWVRQGNQVALYLTDAQGEAAMPVNSADSVEAAEQATQAAQAITTDYNTVQKPAIQQAIDSTITQQAANNTAQTKNNLDVQASIGLINQTVDITWVANEAALAGKPEGNYGLTDTQERLMWNGTGIVPGSRGSILLNPAQAPTQLVDQAALVAYAGAATSASVQSGLAAGLWLRDDTATANGVTVLAGAEPRRWVRADQRLKADYAINRRSIALADGKTAALDANLTDPAGAPITAQQAEWNALVTAWGAGSILDLSGRGNVPLAAQTTKAGLKNVRLDGTGTVLQQAKANTILLQLNQPDNVTVENLNAEGAGTEWNGTNKSLPRGLYVYQGNGFTLRGGTFKRFAYASVSTYQANNTRVEGITVTGLGEYNATTNPRGITNWTMSGNTSDGNFSFGELIDGGSDHWRTGNLYQDAGTGIDTGIDLRRVSITNNNFVNVVGQHAMYLAGIDQPNASLNRVDTYIFDGIKHALQTAATLDSIAGTYIGNSFRNQRGNSWAINIGVQAGTKRHKQPVVIGNVSAGGGGGGVSVRQTDNALVGLNNMAGHGSYGFYALDAFGDWVGNRSNGSGWAGFYASIKTGERLHVRGLTLANYATLDDASVNERATALYALGNGTLRLSGVHIGATTSTKVKASIMAENANTTLELDGTNNAPVTLPVVALGPVTEINGDHTGQIFKTANLAASQYFTAQDGVLRRGRGPGRVFNASALPTSGTFRVQDTIYSTNPASTGYIGWVCTVSGTLGSLTAAQATTTTGSTTVTLDVVPPELKPGDYITVSGGMGKAYVVAIDTAAKTITVNVAGIGNVTQPLALSAPTFKRFGVLEA